MRCARFYYPELIGTQTQLTMPEKLAHYMRTVLRLRTHDAVVLFDGTGMDFHGNIVQCDKKNVVIELHSQQSVNNESPLNLHLGQGLCRGEKMDWIIQKSVELGVTTITPLLCEFGNVKLNATRQAQKQQHWQKVAISACEQCGRSVIPTIHTPLPFADWTQHIEAEHKLILHPGDGGISDTLSNLTDVQSVAFSIGPEGGLSEKEKGSA